MTTTTDHLPETLDPDGTVTGWDQPPAVDDPERGDVPGWVLITLMTAGLVIALWAVAGDALQDVFEQAIARVTGFTG